MHSLRAYHGLLAIAVLAAYLTAEDGGVVHAWLGYGIAALVLVRLALGLAGRKGFDFRRLRPSRAAAAVPAMRRLRHPAIAAALTLAVMINVGASAITGIAMDRGGTLVGQSIRAADGPHDKYADRGSGLIPSARADDGDDDRRGDADEDGDEENGVLGEVHEVLGSLIVALVALHALYMVVFRFPMARYMLFVPARKRN